ncbi:ervatamin-B-like [Pistacia vera]|uniref:ervatamin-B-like n=1 Tax=Pistacia vera TaxID=55513 RepID=UPI0012631CFD|nr:ervatamin-B-like [Pistacia vera]
MAFSNKCQASLLILLAIWAIPALCRFLSEEYVLQSHEEWMALHERVYETAEEKERRYDIFKNNFAHVEKVNNGVDRGFKLAINKFADLTDDEFRSLFTGYKRETSKTKTKPETKSFLHGNFTDVPTYMNWREKGAVTLVKNQGNCGCCWAFSAVAAVEGINQIKTGKLISLSEQELLSCDTQYNKGCLGGSMENAFDFMVSNGGLTTEDDYPYEERQQTCKTDKAARHAVPITGFDLVSSYDEEALLQAVANQPVCVAIEGSGRDFRFYKSGVFKGNCGTNLDHGVTAIGYGTESDGTKYWLVKNSWGTEWGEDGFMRIQRDVEAEEGLCGLAIAPSYPSQ